MADLDIYQFLLSFYGEVHHWSGPKYIFERKFSIYFYLIVTPYISPSSNKFVENNISDHKM